MTTRARAAAVAVLVVVALSGCSHSSTAPAGCSPERPHVSADVVRPGGAVTVSVSAATCRPRFDAGRHLTLTLEDRGGHRTRLATVTAYPSGAFEQEVRIPATTPAGDAGIEITGVETPCGDTGSCAAYETAVDVVDSAPDFASSAHANRVASDLADRMQTALGARSGFVGLAIVPDGVEVVLHTTHRDAETAAAQRAFDAARAAAPRADRALAARAHLHTAFISSTEHALEEMTMRIAHDSAWQKQHHIVLSRWGGDFATDSVRIALKTYRDADAVLLARRYGTAVTVSTADTPFGEAASARP